MILFGAILLSNWLRGPSGWEPGILAWLTVSGLGGVGGGIVTLMHLDGPSRFGARAMGVLGWALMVVGAIAPTLVAPFLAVLVALAGPTMLRRRRGTEPESLTSP